MGSQKSIPAPRHRPAAKHLATWLIAAAVACLGLLPALHGWQHRHEPDAAPGHVAHCHHTDGQAPQHRYTDHRYTDHQHTDHQHADHQHADPADAGTDHPHTHHDSEQDTDHECGTCIMLKIAARGLLIAPPATIAGPSLASLIEAYNGPAHPRALPLTPRSSRGPPLLA